MTLKYMLMAAPLMSQLFVSLTLFLSHVHIDDTTDSDSIYYYFIVVCLPILRVV